VVAVVRGMSGLDSYLGGSKVSSGFHSLDGVAVSKVVMWYRQVGVAHQQQRGSSRRGGEGIVSQFLQQKGAIC
jgi:hypothetical protein